MKKLTLATLVLASLSLAACSSSKSDDKSEAKTKKTSYFKKTEVSIFDNSNTNDKEIVVDGKKISVALPQGVSARGIYSDLNLTVSGTLYKDSTFGYKNVDDKTYFFAKGNITPVASMPTTGEFTYQGTLVNIGEKKDLSLTVNFDKKTVVGNGAHEFIDATIKGNTFSGSNTASIPQNLASEMKELTGKDFNNMSVTTKGQFNGENAAELTGITEIKLENDKDALQVTSSFGAIKQ